MNFKLKYTIFFISIFLNQFAYAQLSEADKKQIEANIQNSSDWQRLSELKMLSANFSNANYQAQIEAIYQQYQFTLAGFKHQQTIQLQSQNAHAMQKMGNKPPLSKDEIKEQFQESKFNVDQSARVNINKEITDLLNEANSLQNITTEQEYYASEKFKSDENNYLKAQKRITQMLEGQLPLSIKEAFYVAEAAYGDLHLSYDEYCKLIQDNSNFIKQWLSQNQYNIADPEALHYGIQKFMSDTLYINVDGKKRGHYPFYYDYIDAQAKSDKRNYFVTKTLATGSGQCHTFPITYLILAETFNLEAGLAYNPQHSFIRYANNKGTMVNYETTIDRFLPNAYYMETLPVMSETQRNSLYVSELTKKQVVASVLFDLASNFIREHWLHDKTFVLQCMNTAEPFFPSKGYINLSHANLYKRLYAEEFNVKVKQKGITNLADIEKYPDLLQAFRQYYQYMESINKLGIQELPDSEYLRMLEYYDDKGKIQLARKINAKTKKSLFINQ